MVLFESILFPNTVTLARLPSAYAIHTSSTHFDFEVVPRPNTPMETSEASHTDFLSLGYIWSAARINIS